MAREYGQYRKMLLEQQKYNGTLGGSYENGDEPGFSWFRIRFYIGLILFVGYVLLDYTGISVQNVTSQQILAVIQQDLTQDFGLDTLLAGLTDQISITKENEHVSDTFAGH